MIKCEFRKICGSSSDSDKFLTRKFLPAVPEKGELININGEPYVVFERNWAISDSLSEVYCYFRLSPLQFPSGIIGEPA